MKTIGSYEIRGLLGRGGMGVVYKCRAPFTGRIVALKVLDPRDELLVELVGRDELKRRFIQEARIMGSVRHPNVAQVLDFSLDAPRPYFTMEYFAHSLGTVIGETYRAEEPTRRLTVEKSVHYVRQVLCGLARLHYAGLVHRDIKPFNILLTEEDEVKIIDFGLSRLRGETSPNARGVNVGSPYYAPPEQERDPEAVDERADLFPTGVMLYRMLTGVIPEPAVVRPQPADRLNPDLDDEWNDFLEKSMAPDPGKRFESAEAMLEELETVYGRWLREGQRICRGFSSDQEQRPEKGTETIRTNPVKVSFKDARQRFELDRLWRPETFHAHVLRPQGEHIVRDLTTGLVWQRRGSLFSLNWYEAREYVQRLNRDSYAGHTGWRLPTVAEIVTLLRPPAGRTDLCLDPVFDKRLRWIWSTDRCSYVSAWLADVEMGYIARQDMAGYARICAVHGEIRETR
ncbi:MAG: protein kinase domain-containing protein [Desulfovibrionales bacterium]